MESKKNNLNSKEIKEMETDNVNNSFQVKADFLTFKHYLKARKFIKKAKVSGRAVKHYHDDVVQIHGAYQKLENSKAGKFNIVQSVSAGIAKENAELLEKLIKFNDSGYVTADSYLEYLAAKKNDESVNYEEKSDAYAGVMSNSKKFVTVMEEFKKSSKKEFDRMVNNYKKKVRKTTLKVASIGLASAMSITGLFGFSSNVNSAVGDNQPSIEDQLDDENNNYNLDNELEKIELSVSGNSVSGNSVSGNSVSGNSVSGNDVGQAETEETKEQETQVETEKTKGQETQVETEETKAQETQVETEETKEQETQVETEETKGQETQVETEETKGQETQEEIEETKAQETQNNEVNTDKADGKITNEKISALLEKYGELLEHYQALRSNLNVSPDEETKYADVRSIGDAVIINDSNAPIYGDMYSAVNQQNEKSAYYGSDEVRYIKSIIMEKDGHVVNVTDMEDYEKYIQLGYSAIDYVLVNQYSMNQNGDMVVEGIFSEENVEILRR